MPENNTPIFDQNDIEQNKTIAVLSCIPILFWLPFVSCNDSGFAKYYANQGLLLLIIDVAMSIITSILALIPILRIVIGVLSGIIGIVTFVFMIIEMVSAGQGQTKPLPIVGGVQIIK